MPRKSKTPGQHQQFSYNQFQTDGSYFQLSLIQNSTESTEPGNTQSTFFSLQQGTKPTNSEMLLDARLNANILGESQMKEIQDLGINVENMDSEDKLMMENMILKNMEDLGNEEKSLMEDIIKMVKENMGSNLVNMVENVKDKNMEFMNNNEKNLMENLLTLVVEMMQDREIMIIENILEQGLKNMNIKEKVLMEDIVEENIDNITNMEIKLMNNILLKDLAKLMMEDVLRMEIMKNINGRMPMDDNPTMKMVGMNIKEAALITDNYPVDSSIFNKAKKFSLAHCTMGQGYPSGQ